MECIDSQPVAVGRCCTWQLRSRVKPIVMCILCQEEQQVCADESQALVYAACIQRSSVLCCPESLDQSVAGEAVGWRGEDVCSSCCGWSANNGGG